MSDMSGNRQDAIERLQKLLEEYLEADDITIFDKQEVGKIRQLLELNIDAAKLKILLSLDGERLRALAHLDANKLKRLQDMDASKLERMIAAWTNVEGTGKTLNFLKNLILWLSGLGGALIILREWILK